MEVFKAIKERASYRGLYKNLPVSRGDLRKIMEAGIAAPSGRNQQTTSLIGVDDPALLQRLYRLINPPIGVTAPAIICVLTQKTIAYRGRCYHVQDYSAAIENMLLAALELGCQSCWVEGHITDTDNIGRQMADVLGVPAEFDLVCFLPIGFPAEPLRYVEKHPFDDRAWFNGFQKEDCERQETL